MSYAIVGLDKLLLTYQSLPLADDNGCGLGVLTKTYFDQISQPDGDGSFEDHVSAAKKQVSEWFRNVVSFNKNLENAFKLWDAVSH